MRLEQLPQDRQAAEDGQELVRAIPRIRQGISMKALENQDAAWLQRTDDCFRFDRQKPVDVDGRHQVPPLCPVVEGVHVARDGLERAGEQFLPNAFLGSVIDGRKPGTAVLVKTSFQRLLNCRTAVYVQHVNYVQEVLVAVPESTKQNITVRLDRRTLRKAKVLAAKRNTSISGLLAAQIETLVGEDDAYEQAHRRALALLDQGLPLGGRIESTRDDWHDR